jgi:hypothetical protein
MPYRLLIGEILATFLVENPCAGTGPARCRHRSPRISSHRSTGSDPDLPRRRVPRSQGEDGLLHPVAGRMRSPQTSSPMVFVGSHRRRAPRPERLGSRRRAVAVLGRRSAAELRAAKLPAAPVRGGRESSHTRSSLQPDRTSVASCWCPSWPVTTPRRRCRAKVYGGAPSRTSRGARTSCTSSWAALSRREHWPVTSDHACLRWHLVRLGRCALGVAWRARLLERVH